MSRTARVACFACPLLSLACGHALPSALPLGVGPLPPQYRLAAKHRTHEDRKGAQPSAAVLADTEPTFVPKTTGENAVSAPVVATPGTTTPSPGPAPQAGKVVAAADYVGEYKGEDVSTYRLSGMPERTDKDPNARVNVTSPDKTRLDVVLVDSSNGKEICTLNATVSGASATIVPGQQCFEQTGADASASATVTHGTVTVDGKKLTLELALNFEMHVPDQDATGTLDYRFDGERK